MRAFGVAATAAVALAAAVLGAFALVHGGTLPVEYEGPVPALALTFGVTPLGGVFCVLLALLDTAVALWSVLRGSALDALLIAAFSASMLLVLCAQSVAVFFFAWETMALLSAFLIAAHHERRSVRRATALYLLVSQTGAACVLVSLVLLAYQAGSPSFYVIAQGAPLLPAGIRNAAIAFALVGFGSKAGFVPLHFWLPRAHPVAPPHASALLSGVMLKVALYGLATATLTLAAPVPLAWGIAIVAIGTASAVAGVLYAVVDRDLKRLLAYSSVENAGIVAIGLGAALVAGAEGLPAVAALALTAALFHAFNHGLFKGLLFLGAGAVADSEGTVDLEKLGGLREHMVWTAPAFLVGCAAIAGLPPFNGFASEWLTFQSLAAELIARDAAAKVATLGALAGLALAGGLAVACFARVYGIAFLGKPRRAYAKPPVRERADAPAAALVMLAALCALFGVLPGLALGPLGRVAASVLGVPAPSFPSLPILPATLALLPLLGALAAVSLAARRGVRSVPTWTCGSPVTPAAAYTATAFAKPLRRIFAFVLAPESLRTLEGGDSPWFPQRIVYQTDSRYLIDETARRFAALAFRVVRRSKLVQSGSLRLYLAYAVGALILTVVAAR
ncbi:MAG: proton-conducting transporter membrane subunit [Vulcanimicrobiaceae bacterium]